MLRKEIFITTLLTIITICSGFGQSSLKLNKLRAYEYDTLEIYNLIDSAEVYLINYPIIAFSMIEKAFELSIKYSNKSTEALCYYYLGRINYNLKI